MYIPNYFQLDESEVADFITNNNFATLISIGADGVLVNYAPLLLDSKNNCLIGHLSNDNSHLQLMNDNQQIVVISFPHRRPDFMHHCPYWLISY